MDRCCYNSPLLGYDSPSASDVSGLIYVDHMTVVYNSVKALMQSKETINLCWLHEVFVCVEGKAGVDDNKLPLGERRKRERTAIRL